MTLLMDGFVLRICNSIVRFHSCECKAFFNRGLLHQIQITTAAYAGMPFQPAIGILQLQRIHFYFDFCE